MRGRRAAIYERWPANVYDVLVVGGGITGAGVARDAALRGLATVLVEKRDFASGTSSKSGKLIHGGLRYLKHFHIGLVREACRERWWLLAVVAPHLVRPVRFVVPFYRTSRIPRWKMALGLVMYDVIAAFRKTGRFRFLSARQVADEEPALATAGCVGGLAYWDCQALDFRLVIDTLKSAASAGADVLNYAELVRVERDGDVWTAAVRDGLEGSEHRVRARTIVNAGGPWADDVQARLDGPRFGLKITAGIHLVLARQRLPVRNTLALESAGDGRMIYIVPWGEYALVGTTDTFFDGDKDRLAVEREAVEYLLAAVAAHFPSQELTRADVLSSFVGLRPLIGSDRGESEDELPRDDQMLVEDDGRVAITGGKLTTYRAMAQRVVDALCERFFGDRRRRACRTIAPISGGARRLPADASARLRGLWARYGDNAEAMQRLIDAEPALGEAIDPRAPFLWAEVIYAIEHEFAERLDDLVERRLGGQILAPDVSLTGPIARFLGLDESGLISQRTRQGAAT